MNILVRFVNINHPDLVTLVVRLDQYFTAQFGDMAEQYRGHNDLSGMTGAVVAYTGDRAIGCGCWKPYDAVTAELKHMFVLPDYRREGVALQIVHALEEHAVASGCHKAVLETGTEMTDAIRFYQRAGYRLTANYGAFVDDILCVCMAKEISDGTMR